MGYGDDSQERLRGLMGFLKGLTGNQPEFEPLATLSDAQYAEWKEVERLATEADLTTKEAEARRELFWIRLRRALGPEGDRDGLRVEDRLVLGSKRVQTEKPGDLAQLGDE
jgi:hypothetical protein